MSDPRIEEIRRRARVLLDREYPQYLGDSVDSFRGCQLGDLNISAASRDGSPEDLLVHYRGLVVTAVDANHFENGASHPPALVEEVLTLMRKLMVLDDLASVANAHSARPDGLASVANASSARPDDLAST